MKEKKKKRKKKQNSTELQKPNVDVEVYNNNKKCDWIYTYTPIKTVQQNKVQLIDPVKKGNQKLYLPVRTKLTKAQTGKQN